MLRTALVATAALTLAACSSAVGSAPAIAPLDAPSEAAAPGSSDVSTSAPSDSSTATTEGATTSDAAVATSDAAPSTDAQPTDVASAPDDSTAAPTADVVEPTAALAPPDPPLVAVWQEDGPDTQRAQEYLLSLGFWLAEANGEYGQTTTQAVMAFQKYYGLAADGKLGPQTAEAMNAATERPTGRANDGTLVEVDKSKQLLFLVRDGATAWVLNTSTGSEVPYREPDQNTPGAFIEDESITRPGLFAVDRERAEGWWEGDLGEIYRPKYFDGGIALHGSYNIPPYPASHGCVRLSIQAMDWIWAEDLVPMGTTVWVHGEIPERDA